MAKRAEKRLSKKAAKRRRNKAAAPTRRSGRATKRVGLPEVLRWLERTGTKAQLRELDRYGIEATRPFGVRVGDLKKKAKEIGTDHALARALWDTGRYEARMLAAMVDDPARVTVSQMNAWARDFDNWAIVDTVCFHLFDRTKHAWKKVPQWARARKTYTKRAGLALLWSLSVHDREAADADFERFLPLVEHAAADGRDMVEKGASMALRAVGKRNAALNRAALRVADRLAASEDAGPRRVGKQALRELKNPV